MAKDPKTVVPISGKASTTSEFFVPTQDGHGHTGDFHCRIHPGMIRDVAELFAVGKDKVGWKTQDDCERYVVLEGLKAATVKLKAQSPSSLTALNLYMKNIGMEIEQAQVSEVLRDTQKVIEYLQKINAHERVREIVRDGWRAINQVGFPHWREHLLREFERAFGHLMSRKGSLDPKDATRDEDD